VTLRVALAGAGMVSRHHLIAWRRCAGAKVVAIADPNADARNARAQEFDVPACYCDVASMLSAGGVDALDVATPLATHAALIGLAIQHGIPVLCQKPLAATANEARVIAAEAQANGVRLMVHENWRFRPYYLTIKAWITAGRIGRPRAFQLATLGSGLLSRAGETPPGLVRQPFLKTMPRLLILELLIHHFDTLGFLFGPLSVEAAHVATLSPYVSGEDTATLALQGEGIAGSVFASMAAAGLPSRGSDRLEVLGEAGRVRLSGTTLTLDAAEPAHRDIDLEADYQASYDNTVAHFASALRDGTPFATSPEIHFRALELVEAAYSRAGVPPPPRVSR